MRNLLLTGMLLAFSAAARADGWVLDNDASILNFVSVKAGTIAELNRFEELAGTIDKDGKTLKIDMADEIVAGTLIMRDGAIVHPKLAGAAAAPAPAKNGEPAAKGD